MSERIGGDLEQLRRIDDVCEQVEQAWRDGERPSIESVLGRCRAEDREALLIELLQIEFDHRRRRRECLALADYRTRFPDDAAAVEKAWRDGAALDGTGSFETGLHHAADTCPQPEKVETMCPELPAGYESVERIGAGGM